MLSPMSSTLIDAQTRFDRHLDRSPEALARREVVLRAREAVLPRQPPRHAGEPAVT